MKNLLLTDWISRVHYWLEFSIRFYCFIPVALLQGTVVRSRKTWNDLWRNLGMTHEGWHESHSEAGCFTEFWTRVSNIRNEFKLKFTGEWKHLKASHVTSHAHPDTLNNLENCCKEKKQTLEKALNRTGLGTENIYGSSWRTQGFLRSSANANLTQL